MACCPAHDDRKPEPFDRSGRDSNGALRTVPIGSKRIVLDVDEEALAGDPSSRTFQRSEARAVRGLP